MVIFRFHYTVVCTASLFKLDWDPLSYQTLRFQFDQPINDQKHLFYILFGDH